MILRMGNAKNTCGRAVCVKTNRLSVVGGPTTRIARGSKSMSIAGLASQTTEINGFER